MKIQINEHYTFLYYGGGTEKELISRSHQKCKVLRRLTKDEADIEVGPMYHVKFADGHEADVFVDELH